MATTSRVPRLTRQYLEQKAEEVLEWFDPARLREPSLTPLAAIAERFRTTFAVQFRFDVPLGVSPRGNKILGLCDLNARAIYLDPTLDPNGPRYRFTLAHEMGHLVLHRKLPLTADDLDGASGSISDGRRHIFFGRRRPQTGREWLEWQANGFAIGLLMPRSTVRQAITDKQYDLGITRRLGTIYLDNQPTNIDAYRRIIEHLQLIYQASRTMVLNRLRNLRLLDDYRTFSPRHITRLFAEDEAA